MKAQGVSSTGVPNDWFYGIATSQYTLLKPTGMKMQRILEPEIMEDVEQAKAYDAADFSRAHDRRVEVFSELAPPQAINGLVLDLGCGSGDLDFRLLSELPSISLIGIDGSREMIKLAMSSVAQRPDFQERATFIESYIPSEKLPRGPYVTIMSNSFLHHLHNPQVLWDTIKQLATSDTFIFVSDLRRPETLVEAATIMENLAGSEPEVLKRDFFNSLCAAFEVSEVDAQIRTAGLAGLEARPLDDIHLVVSGFVRC